MGFRDRCKRASSHRYTKIVLQKDVLEEAILVGFGGGLGVRDSRVCAENVRQHAVRCGEPGRLTKVSTDSTSRFRASRLGLDVRSFLAPGLPQPQLF